MDEVARRLLTLLARLEAEHQALQALLARGRPLKWAERQLSEPPCEGNGRRPPGLRR